jgi:hypothetical protein
MSEPEWIPCEDNFVVSDVIAFTRAIWPETRRKRTKARPLGETRVTAQILEIDSRGYVRLSILKDEITRNEHGMPLRLLKKGEIVVKKRATITRGKPVRLKWTEEAVRANELSPT